MSYGLKLWGSSGALTYNSDDAAGGVCLGLYTVASGGSTWTFPDIAGATGVALFAGYGASIPSYTTDSSLGYLRFIFAAAAAGMVVALFAK